MMNKKKKVMKEVLNGLVNVVAACHVVGYGWYSVYMISSFQRDVDENCTLLGENPRIFEPWRWDLYVAQKRQYGITATHCIIAQKSTVLSSECDGKRLWSQEVILYKLCFVCCITGELGICIWNKRCTVSCTHYHEWRGPEISHL